MGSCWGKGIRGNPGSGGGCRSPERSAEGVAHQEGLVRPGNTMVKMLYLGYECTLAYGLGAT